MCKLESDLFGKTDCRENILKCILKKKNVKAE
jgi:hypothetical protein